MATLCPVIHTEDAAEFSTAAAVLGVPHPPGYPLYTLLAGLFVRAVRIGDIAYRSNLFSAVCGALTVALLWLLMRRLGIGRLAALVAALCFALGRIFWSQCLAAEVHALNCLLLTAAMLCTIEAARSPSRRTFALAGAAIGLLVGHRNLNAVYVPAFFALLEVARRRIQGCKCFHAWAVGAAAATIAVYLYLPWAGRHDPPLYVGAPSTWGRFYSVISAQPYFRHFASGPASANAGRVLAFLTHLPSNLGIAAFAAPVGLWVAHRRTGPLLPAVLAYMTIATVGFAALYNVIDVDAYFLPATLALALAAAFAFDALAQRARFARPVRTLAVVIAGVVAVAVVAVALLPLNMNVSLRDTRLADRYGRDLLRSAPARAVVIPFGDTAKHVLGYLQAVERARPDVVVVSPDDIADWYVDQLRRRHPDLDLPGQPTAPADPDWFLSFIRNNLSRRPICLTQPLTLGFSEWTVTPAGLLYCFRPRSAAPGPAGIAGTADLARSAEFWSAAVHPSAAELNHPDVHVRMLVFSFAMARFALAQALAEAGDLESARLQLRSVEALHPDDQEQAITAAMRTIGRQPSRPFLLGAKAQRALLAGAADREAIRAALADDRLSDLR